MHEAALEAKEDPDRLSFLHSVRVVRRKIASWNAIPPCEEKTISSQCDPLAKLASGYRLCQGTTSVVAKMVNSDSGFSRCGIANN